MYLIVISCSAAGDPLLFDVYDDDRAMMILLSLFVLMWALPNKQKFVLKNNPAHFHDSIVD